jgi:hypothetical protein
VLKAPESRKHRVQEHRVWEMRLRHRARRIEKIEGGEEYLRARGCEQHVSRQESQE